MEKKEKDLLIIIPAYNEENNLPKVLDDMEEAKIYEYADVLVINDASSDHTNWMVKKKKVALVTLVFNLGYGNALQLGYKYAIRRKYKYVIQLDADGQHDICNIPIIYEKLKTKDENGEYPDIVLGSRFLEGSAEYKVSFAKKIAIGFFKNIINKFSGSKITDPTSGLQGLSYRTVLYYSKYNHFDDKYPDTNIILTSLFIGFNIKEIPAVMHYRTEGTSMHSGLKPVLYMFKMFLAVLGVLLKRKYIMNNSGRIKGEKQFD